MNCRFVICEGDEVKDVRDVSSDNLTDGVFDKMIELHRESITGVLDGYMKVLDSRGSLKPALAAYHQAPDSLTEREKRLIYWKNYVLRSEGITEWVIFMKKNGKDYKMVSLGSIGTTPAPGIEGGPPVHIGHLAFSEGLESKQFVFDYMVETCKGYGLPPTILCRSDNTKEYTECGFEIRMNSGFCSLLAYKPVH